jgi:hypothetical protein
MVPQWFPKQIQFANNPNSQVSDGTKITGLLLPAGGSARPTEPSHHTALNYPLVI